MHKQFAAIFCLFASAQIAQAAPVDFQTYTFEAIGTYEYSYQADYDYLSKLYYEDVPVGSKDVFRSELGTVIFTVRGADRNANGKIDARARELDYYNVSFRFIDGSTTSVAFGRVDESNYSVSGSFDLATRQMNFRHQFLNVAGDLIYQYGYVEGTRASETLEFLDGNYRTSAIASNALRQVSGPQIPAPSAVPLPASGLMLLSGFGLFALLRRRKNQPGA
ncbi:VPLPA-CTERM sorting domain-containing protein [Dinoroseobacter sp. PD6]|uniref:VPLPA-CTERM sorting domain-containing protein n=1 Tax=Dinoroseobacter sp. PD6 TaxID=3028384 RepID=UPI00237AB76D|nr:VPLPA-CTERM sorting domain-containing protein [Dinoroseobacter sp. PD6]MDD9718423.1 VPLPA-CTERM sorting domain-containing protein [Dinoroseobacter sp. PD6]